MSHKNLIHLFSFPFALFLALVGCASVSGTGGITTTPSPTLTPPGGSAKSSYCTNTACANATYYKLANFFAGYSLAAGTHRIKVTDNNGGVVPAANYFVAVTCGTNKICACESFESNQKVFTGPAYPKYYFTVCFTAIPYPSSVTMTVQP